MADTVEVLFDDAASLAQGLQALNDDDIAELRTAPGAAARYGAAYLRAVIDRSTPHYSDAVIDCGDDVALVFKSLSAGWQRIAFAGAAPVAKKLTNLAFKRRVTVLTA